MAILSPTGSIIWIPQLFINYQLKSYHQIFFAGVSSKVVYFIAQILSLPYFFDAGLFWLLIKNYPAAILGQLINSLLCFVMIYQLPIYDRIWDFTEEYKQKVLQQREANRYGY